MRIPESFAGTQPSSTVTRSGGQPDGSGKPFGPTDERARSKPAAGDQLTPQGAAAAVAPKLQALKLAEAASRYPQVMKDPETGQVIGNANAALVSSIAQALKQAAGKGRRSQQVTAVLSAAAQIDKLDPSNPYLSGMVDQAVYNQLVQPGINAVADAYDKAGGGTAGAKAAAQTLVQQEQSVGPEIAARILAGSLPTVNKIAVDLSKDANTLALDPYLSPSSPEVADFEQTYGALSQALDLAGNAPGGEALTLQIGHTFAADISAPPAPSRIPTIPLPPTSAIPVFQMAAQATTANGGAVGLSAAIAASLARGPNAEPGGAGIMLTAISKGLDAFNSKIKGDLQAWGQAGAQLNSLSNNWSGLLTPQQLSKAVSANLGAVNGTRAAVSQDGYAAMRDLIALRQLQPSLASLTSNTGYPYLAAASANLAQTQATQMSIALSPQALAQAAAFAGQESAPLALPGSQASSNALATLGGATSFVNAVTKGEEGREALLEGVGAFTGGGALGPLTTLYRALGLGGSAYELAGLTASMANAALKGTGKHVKPPPQWVQNWLSNPKADPQYKAMWAHFNAAFALAGFTLDSATTVANWRNQDWGQNASALATDTGDFLGLLRTAANAGWIDGAAGDALAAAAWADPVSAGLIAAGAGGSWLFSTIRSASDWQSSNAQFLADAGINPSIATALVSNKTSSPKPVLDALANYLKASPSSVLAFLNGQNATKVQEFVDLCQFVQQNSNGTFAKQAANDRNVQQQPSVYGVGIAISEDANDLPRSLRGLAQLAWLYFDGQFPGVPKSPISASA
jgi:hypothetical protein